MYLVKVLLTCSKDDLRKLSKRTDLERGKEILKSKKSCDLCIDMYLILIFHNSFQSIIVSKLINFDKIYQF